MKYKPSKKWLQNTGENFSGKVSMVKDSKFSKLTSAKTTSKKKEMDDCIDDVVVYWTCSNGNPHSPYANESDCNVNNGEHSYVIEIVYGVCPGNGSSGDFDSSTGTPSGTSTSGGGSNTIITAPNTVPYDYELKNFLSGVLNNIERNYYNSNSNIRNYTDRYLIDNNFSGPSQFISKNALEFGCRFQLNFEQFIWAFNHINDSDFLELQNQITYNSNNQLAHWSINLLKTNDGTKTSEVVSFLNQQNDYKSQMSESEKTIFDSMSYDNQMNYLMSAFQAKSAAENKFTTPCEISNGKGDAFRHSYWNALCRRRLGLDLTKQLTTAHEEIEFKYSYHYKEKQMDLYNNIIGMSLTFNEWATIFTIQESIDNLSQNGKLRHLNFLDANCRASQDSELTPTN